jgi:hypothetical protein
VCVDAHVQFRDANVVCRASHDLGREEAALYGEEDVVSEEEIVVYGVPRVECAVADVVGGASR